MGWFTGLIMFALVWWTVLFAVLPLGQRPEAEADPVSGFRGLPRAPRLGRVALITTLVSLVIWLGCEVLVHSDVLSFRHGLLAFHPG